VDECPSEVDSLLLSRAEGGRPLLEKWLQVEQIGEFFDSVLGDVGRNGVDVGEVIEDLAGREPLVQARAGRNEADSLFDGLWLLRDAEAIDDDVARAGLEQAENASESRRFPGTVGPEEAVHFTRFDPKAELIDRRKITPVALERLRQAIDNQHAAEIQIGRGGCDP